MTATRTVLILALAATALSFAPGRQEGVVVRSCKVSEPSFDDLGHVLGVVRLGGEFDLRGVTNRVGLFFEIHKKGKRSGDPIRSVFLAARKEEQRQGRFSIQVADLDHLKLGDAPKGHHRVFIALQEGGSTCRGAFDLPKALFDFSTIRGAGTFAVVRAEKGRIPLFYRVGGIVAAIGAGETPDQVLKSNAEADVLLAYLEVE